MFFKNYQRSFKEVLFYKYYPQNFFWWMLLWVIEMLQYRKIKVSDEIDINKLNKSKECMICHYWYFKDISYELEPFVCNKCHDISIMAYELENIAVLNLKRCWL